MLSYSTSLFANDSSSESLGATKTYLVSTHNDDVISEILFKELAQGLSLQFEFIRYANFSSALNAVEEGDVDFMANVIPTEMRKTTLDFSVPTNIQDMYFFNKSSDVDYRDIKKIAVPKRDVSHLIFKALFPEVEIVTYSGAKEAAKLIEKHEADGVIASINYLKVLSNKGYISHQLGSFYPLRPVAIAAAKGHHSDLLDLFGKKAHETDVQRSYHDAINRYKNHLRIFALRKRLENDNIFITKPLRIKLLNSSMHTKFLQDGSVDGISADVVLEACRVLALPCEVVSDAQEPWSVMYQDMLNGDIDILAPLVKTEERERIFNFSKSYYQQDVILVKRKGYKHNYYHSVLELFAERVATVENSIFESTLKEYLPHKKLGYYKTNKELVTALLNNDVDYITMTTSNYNQFILDSDGKLPITKVTSIGSFISYPMGISFQKTEQGEKLADLFSGAINLINLKEIYRKYEHSVDWQEKTNRQQDLTTLLFVLFIIFSGLLTSIAYYWHKKSRTDALTLLRNRYALYHRYGKGIPKGEFLIYFDLNKFKSINDDFSHYVGDKVLKSMARNIKKHWLGKSYRIGGDEFVLVGECEQDIHEKMATIGCFDYITTNKEIIPVSISYGVYYSADESLSLDEVLKIADNEMYEYKLD